MKLWYLNVNLSWNHKNLNVAIVFFFYSKILATTTAIFLL